MATWAAETSFAWIMEERGTEKVVGSIAAYPSEYAVELGYLMSPDSRGRGFMVEAVDAVSAWFLSRPSIWRVWAEVDTENLASVRVLEKASFEREGRLRRHIMSPNISTDPRDAFVYGRVD